MACSSPSHLDQPGDDADGNLVNAFGTNIDANGHLHAVETRRTRGVGDKCAFKVGTLLAAAQHSDVLARAAECPLQHAEVFAVAAGHHQQRGAWCQRELSFKGIQRSHDQPLRFRKTLAAGEIWTVIGHPHIEASLGSERANGLSHMACAHQHHPRVFQRFDHDVQTTTTGDAAAFCFFSAQAERRALEASCVHGVESATDDIGFDAAAANRAEQCAVAVHHHARRRLGGGAATRADHRGQRCYCAACTQLSDVCEKVLNHSGGCSIRAVSRGAGMVRSMNRVQRIVVVGGGHAGAEAARAAALLGVETVLLTLDPSAVGRMSCNPSIGGQAKGQIVREVDALGGLMGRAADRSGIHFRVLNRSKGPAMHSPRAQCDRTLYEQEVRGFVDAAGVKVLRGEVAGLRFDGRNIAAVVLADGTEIECGAVVLTTGTFLGGVLHAGEDTQHGGRLGEGAAHLLSRNLSSMGLRMGRLKTGTPPRLLRSSIAWDQLELQPSEEPPQRFSFLDEPLLPRRVDCAITRTTPEVHAVIAGNLHRSPMFAGRIQGRGPRYCPSIEDKIHRFADKNSHQIFLEPEGLDNNLIYPNGISTSLPKDVQEEFVRLIPGLEQAEFAAHGYAVEYDHVDPTECDHTLGLKAWPGVYLGGQINGTTGYEEAAGQGFLAGANAALALTGAAPLVLGRHEAYLGVLVDDLVLRGVSEPYRMFTSLAEHRLLLRHHDADVRLAEHAIRLGVLESAQCVHVAQRRERRERAQVLLVQQRFQGRSLEEQLRTLNFGFADALAASPELQQLRLDQRDQDELGMAARYSGYVARELDSVERRRAEEGRLLPAGFDYAAVSHLRAEAREKLGRIRPTTVGQAMRIPGISPADMATVLLHVSVAERKSGTA